MNRSVGILNSMSRIKKGIALSPDIWKFSYSVLSRLYSSDENRKSWTVLSNNGQIICCWHPEEAPPYEHTKPLPDIAPEFREGDSVLKVQYRRDAKIRFQPDGPTMEELAKMTYTTKHRWYPNNEKKYLDPEPINRDGI
ncbi:large ribosomal subunit protein mL42 [Parasteatoda tepidariorum]|uniref:large ribosomal subunit protein mL42 n=1 Tax=Parasteatoda tepidariorum TaxID=114398 RepID=UPI001C71CE91|nr:39S ribosomal protein L42, mitochondrial [Parasteatoda tepidariorum]